MDGTGDHTTRDHTTGDGATADGTPGGGARSGAHAGGGVSRRRLGARLLALGGVLVLHAALPAGSAAAGGPAERRALQGLRLRYGSARQAGLLERHLEGVADEARRFLGPSPEHPYYAGAVVLAGRGRTVALHRAMGDAVRYADYDGRTDRATAYPAAERIAMAEDTVFDLASLTKLFTSILAVQQMERGRLELEAPVRRHLPEFTGGGKERITVRQLLTHTSGLRSWAPFYQESTRAGQLRLLWSVQAQETPGSVYRYSDLNLITLQLLLERITGRTLDVLLHDEITAPLGMHRTRFNPPLSWRRVTAATEVQRPPWSGLDRGLVWGEVHDENAYALGGVAGHAGVFGTAWDLAVLARTLLDGGAYAGRRILRPGSVELLFTDYNTAFPGDDHGLGFELYQHWYMGAMATPHSAGHTGFTGTSLVLDPSTDSFLVLLGNAVHPVRTWRAGSAPRVAVGNRFARAVPVRTRHGGAAWFSGISPGGSGTLTLPPLTPAGAAARLRCAVWWDTVPGAGAFHLEASADGETWRPLPFSTVRSTGGTPEQWPRGCAGGWSGRVWHRLEAPLTAAWAGREVRLRFRHAATGRYVGRGVYVDVVRVSEPGRLLFSDDRPADAARLDPIGWTRSAD
ncbi:serine hydrolase [Streptomyces subrutilus]|uniref:Serine hydrolase n=1 Tax=Streptomyces subrutilus TaxID=36818 RepID=A0A5P2UYT4_9ACTN|nr:serine hydrolase domain-containing protein [Streptomyces subrutilus]QEU81917.1 class A beta-lactamase-related serine hydrolase [Streptomyces subrutilus]GGZ71769.1 serine hydrolase [Streptomyces subrutilus]